jgi:2-polyprenyl-6-methoxyphenol hydroxylase-like FAD-dependent oxidoreductase
MQSADRSRHDVVVVGGRVAGSATAMLLARLGHDVVVLDQASVPSDTVSTHAIARSGVVQLHRWGLLNEVLDSGTPAIRQVTFNAAGKSITRTIKEKAGSTSWSRRGGTCWTRSLPPPRNTPAPRCTPATP